MGQTVRRLIAPVAAAVGAVGYYLLLRHFNANGDWGSFWLRATWPSWQLTPWAKLYVAGAVVVALVVLAAAKWPLRATTLVGITSLYFATVGLTMLAVPRFQVLATRFEAPVTVSFMIRLRFLAEPNAGYCFVAVAFAFVLVYFVLQRTLSDQQD